MKTKTGPQSCAVCFFLCGGYRVDLQTRAGWFPAKLAGRVDGLNLAALGR